MGQCRRQKVDLAILETFLVRRHGQGKYDCFTWLGRTISPMRKLQTSRGIISTMRSNMSLAKWPGFLRAPLCRPGWGTQGPLWRISNLHELFRCWSEGRVCISCSTCERETTWFRLAHNRFHRVRIVGQGLRQNVCLTSMETICLRPFVQGSDYVFT